MIRWIIKSKSRRNVSIKLMILSFIALITTICIYFYSIELKKQYPHNELTREQLYGIDGQNLKDFILEEDGLLVSTSADPWMEVFLEAPINIKTVTIYVDSISTEGLWGQFFVIDEQWESQNVFLCNGRNTLIISNDQNIIGADRIRLDPVSYSNMSVKIEKVVFNETYALLRNAYELGVVFVAFSWMLCCALVSVVEHSRQCKKSKGILFLGVVEIALSIAQFCIHISSISNGQNSLIHWSLLITFLIYLNFLLDVGKSDKPGNKFWLVIELILISFMQFGMLELLNGVRMDIKDIAAVLLNVAMCLAVFGLCGIIVSSYRISIIAGSVFFIFLGVINHFYFIFRGEPFELFDWVMADTALSVLGNYHFEIDETLMSMLLMEAAIVLSVGLLPKIRIWKKKVLMLGYMVGEILLISIIYPRIPRISYWNISENTSQYGYLSSFVGYIKYANKAQKPEGYQKSSVEDIFAVLNVDEEKEVTQAPNIIVIMDEAFADLPSIYGFETNMDALPFIHSLTENTIKGECLVSVMGGSTSDTEYEFLTGNSMGMLPVGAVPYIEYIKSEQQSLVTLLRNQGYSAIAYHPYDETGYNRHLVYPLLGFEDFITLDDPLPNTDKVREYMSDLADFQNIEYLYENRDTDKPFFIFNVTMQNHGGYANDLGDVTSDIYPVDEQLRSPELNEYLGLIKETDTAFEQLVDYFSSVEEDTIILLFGDHQPGLGRSAYSVVHSAWGTDTAILEEKQKQFLTSFVLWANYDIGEKEDVLTSVNFLRPLLLENALVRLSKYDLFLNLLQTECLAVNICGYYGSDGVWHENLVEENEYLKQYSYLVYNNVFDKKNIVTEAFE